MKNQTSKTILLVEDEVVTAIAQQRTLENFGHRVLVVNTGEEAVGIFNEPNEIDLVLMDINLGTGMDGTEAAEIILKKQEVPLIFLSSHIEPEVVERTEGITSYGYIVKNSGPTVLKASIKMAFRLFEARLGEKEKEKILREKEEIFRTVLENLPGAVFAHDLEGRFVFINRAASTQTGYSRKELLEMSVPDVAPDAIEKNDRDLLWHSLKVGDSTIFERMLLRKDGSEYKAEIHLSMIILEGSPTLLPVVFDISERYKAEEELHFLNQIFSNLPQPVSFISKGYILKAANSAYFKHLGIARDHMIGRRLVDLMDREIFEKDIKPYLDRCFSGKQVHFYFDMERLGLGKQVMAMRYFPYKDEKGEITGVISHAIDVTKLKEAEIAIQRNEENLRITLDSISEAVIAVDLEGKIIRMNQAAQKFTGLDFEKIRDRFYKQLFKIVNTDDMKKEFGIEDLFVNRKDIDLSQSSLLVPDKKKEFKIRGSASLIIDDNNDPAGVVIVFQDRSDESLSERLIKTRFMLIDSAESHSLDEFLIKALDEICVYGESPIGFYHFIDEDQKNITLQQWSSRTLKEFCKAESKGKKYSIDEAGAWIDCVRQKKAVVHNDYASLPNRKGLPEGHAEVIRELVVPVIREDKVVAILGIGNKPDEYTEEDVEIVSYLADITWELVKRKRAELELLEREKQFRSLFENNSLSMLLIDPDTGEILDANIEASKFYGWSREILREMRIFDLNTLSPEEIKSEMAAARRLKKRYFCFKHRLSNGDIRDVDFYCGAIIKMGKEILYSSIIDVTDRKKAEHKLKESEELFRKAFYTNPDAININRLSDGMYININEGFTRHTGYTRNDTIGKTSAEINIWNDPLARIHLIEVLRRKDSVYEYEAEFKMKSGEIRIGLMSASVIDINNEKAILSITRDITEARRAEIALEESEERLSLVLRGANFGLWDWNVVTGEVSFNERWAEMLGYELNELEPRIETWEKLVHPDDMPMVRIRLNDHLEGKTDYYETEHRMLAKDGTWKWILDSGKVVERDKKNRPVRAAGTHLDITVRRQAQENIKKLLEEKEVLLREAHHRIKNNMTTVENLLQLQAVSLTNPEAATALQDAMGRVVSMRVLYEKMLVSGEYQELSVKKYLNGLIDSIFALFNDGTEIKLKRRVSDFNLNSKTIFSLGIIVNELLTNILKYAFLDRDKGEVDISLVKKNGHVTLVISDNGIGLPEEFDIKASKGFGLMLVSMLCEQIRGTFNIVSQNGTKTTVRFDV